MLPTARRIAATLLAAALAAVFLIGGASAAHAEPNSALKRSDAGFRAAAAAWNNASNATNLGDRAFWLHLHNKALDQAYADRRAGS